MKAIVTLCFIFTFTQVVVSGVRYGDRTIRQAVETAQDGQLQQPPVDLQSSAVSSDTVSLPSTNLVTPALNSQPNIPAVLSSSSLENVQTTLSLDQSQIPSNLIVSPTPSSDGTSNIPAQIPQPNQSLTSTSPSTPSCSISSNYGAYQSTPSMPQSQILSNPITSPYDISQSSTLPPSSQMLSNPSIFPNSAPIHPSQVVSPNVITSYNNFPAPSLQYPSQIPSSPITSNSISQPTPLTYPSQIPSSPVASPNSFSQSTPLSYPSQVSSNMATSYGNPQATPLIYSSSQIPRNPVASPYGNYPGFSNLPQQSPIQGYPYVPVSPYGSPYYNPYYSQYSMANMNPQMMYGMSPYQMPYMPFAPPLFPTPAMNYTSASTLNSNQTTPQITSSYPVPPNYIPAPSDADQSATPTVVSSTGESGTDLNSLPPQVKEFIDMIPQILSMDESSQAQNTPDFKRPPVRKYPKLPPTRNSLLKKKQYYNSNSYPSASYSGYSQSRYGDYY